MEEVDNKKLSYEELTNVANGLKEQNNASKWRENLGN